jgi:hypothetical protein
LLRTKSPEVDRAQRLPAVLPRGPAGAERRRPPAREQEDRERLGQNHGEPARAVADHPQHQPRQLQRQERAAADEERREPGAGERPQVGRGVGAHDQPRRRRVDEEPGGREHRADAGVVEREVGQVRRVHPGRAEDDGGGDRAADPDRPGAAPRRQDHGARPDVRPAHPRRGEQGQRRGRAGRHRRRRGDRERRLRGRLAT